MVNTFLVHANYDVSAKMLDNRRLGKQRVEAHMIITTLASETDKIKNDGKKTWINHPATQSWKGHVDSLKLYFNAVVREWVNRGYKNNYTYFDVKADSCINPPWTRNPKIHYSMMAQLIQKEPSYYNSENLRNKIPTELLNYFLSMPTEYTQYGYIWPCKWTSDELDRLPIADLAGPAIKRAICRGHYKNGKPCRNKALSSKMFCGLHSL